MIPTDQALETGPNVCISVVLTKLDSLVLCTITIAEIRLLGVSQVYTEAFGGTSVAIRADKYGAAREDTHNPIARAKLIIPSSVRTAGELKPDTITWKCNT